MKKFKTEILLDGLGLYVDGRALLMLISKGLIEDSFGEVEERADRMMEAGRKAVIEILENEP